MLRWRRIWLPKSKYVRIPHYVDNTAPNIKILTDGITSDPLIDFERYGEILSDIIRASFPKFSIGIYGEKGTGRTTLMRMVSKKLRREIASWNNIPEDNNSNEQLTKWLKQRFGLECTESQATRKTNDGNSLEMYDKTLLNHLTLTRNKENTMAILKMNEEPIYEFILDTNEEGNLMLTESSILTIWFNAWRYAREDQYALISLMKTIAYATENHRIFRDIMPIFLKSASISPKISEELLRAYSTGQKNFEKELLPKMASLSQIDRDSIYFDGLVRIENEMMKIHSRYPESRLVIFIDDIDRCSPAKAIEVLDAIKLLQILGLVFVIGVDPKIIGKLIEAGHGKDIQVKGEEYIQEFIQVPVILPERSQIDTEHIIMRLAQSLSARHRNIISENAELILDAIGANSAEIIRFINGFITINEVYSQNPRIKSTELLAIQALKLKWNNFCRNLVTREDFRGLVRNYVPMRQEDRISNFNKLETKYHTADTPENLILDYKSEIKL